MNLSFVDIIKCVISGVVAGVTYFLCLFAAIIWLQW